MMFKNKTGTSKLPEEVRAASCSGPTFPVHDTHGSVQEPIAAKCCPPGAVEPRHRPQTPKAVPGRHKRLGLRLTGQAAPISATLERTGLKATVPKSTSKTSWAATVPPCAAVSVTYNHAKALQTEDNASCPPRSAIT